MASAKLVKSGKCNSKGTAFSHCIRADCLEYTRGSKAKRKFLAKASLTCPMGINWPTIDQIRSCGFTASVWIEIQ